MGVIKLNGKEYGRGGGGGNANIVELTQAEYDALPESKLTDGILYCITDGDGDVINFVNGVYVNPDNLIVSETTFTGSMSYTATQDCIVCIYLVCLGNASTYIKIDNKTVQNYWQSTMVTTASAPIYVKKGQILTVSGAHRDYDSSYWVYGVQTGSVSNAQHNYSTSEQVIGTWIDGKTLCEKVITGISAYRHPSLLDLGIPISETIVKAEMQGIATISGTDYVVSGSTFLWSISQGQNNGAVYISKGTTNYEAYYNGSSTSDVNLIIQYTKTTD